MTIKQCRKPGTDSYTCTAVVMLTDIRSVMLAPNGHARIVVKSYDVPYEAIETFDEEAIARIRMYADSIDQRIIAMATQEGYLPSPVPIAHAQ